MKLWENVGYHDAANRRLLFGALQSAYQLQGITPQMGKQAGDDTGIIQGIRFKTQEDK